MPAGPTVNHPGTDSPRDPFEALDQEFETVQGALVRGGLDPDEAQVVGRHTMIALWRWSADHDRLLGPGLAELATRVADAIRLRRTTRERSSGER
jgi:hypothetical protein